MALSHDRAHARLRRRDGAAVGRAESASDRRPADGLLGPQARSTTELTLVRFSHREPRAHHAPRHARGPPTAASERNRAHDSVRLTLALDDAREHQSRVPGRLLPSGRSERLDALAQGACGSSKAGASRASAQTPRIRGKGAACRFGLHAPDGCSDSSDSAASVAPTGGPGLLLPTKQESPPALLVVVLCGREQQRPADCCRPASSGPRRRPPTVHIRASSRSGDER
jgi:hypothetical protein